MGLHPLTVLPSPLQSRFDRFPRLFLFHLRSIMSSRTVLLVILFFRFLLYHGIIENSRFDRGRPTIAIRLNGVIISTMLSGQYVSAGTDTVTRHGPPRYCVWSLDRHIVVVHRH